MKPPKELDLFGQPLPTTPARVSGTGYGPATTFAGRKRRGNPNGYAATPGGGPAGEFCRTCAHLCHTGNDGKFKKCGLLRAVWTHGAATDIRAKTPACQLWKKREPLCEACASPFTGPGQICPECLENNRPGGPGGGRE